MIDSTRILKIKSIVDLTNDLGTFNVFMETNGSNNLIYREK